MNGITIKEICKKLGGCSVSHIHSILKKNNIQTKSSGEVQRKYPLKFDFFDVVDTEEKAYFLGLLYADGYNNVKKGEVTLSLIELDKDILEKLTLLIQPTKPLFFRDFTTIRSKGRNVQNQYCVSIANRHFSNKLSDLGCIQAKTHFLKFPTEEQVPKYLQRHFIRGYFDGDGCISGKIPQIDIVGTEDFLICLQNILMKSLNVSKTKLCKRHKDKKDKITSLRYSGKGNVKKFRNYIYDNSTIFLNRKYNKMFSYDLTIKIKNCANI